MDGLWPTQKPFSVRCWRNSSWKEFDMLLDGRSVPDGSAIEGEVCLIGAGAAGLAIAQEFLASKINIILIESGGLEYEDATQSLYEGEDKSVELANVRMRYFGGSTNCWHGRCAPTGLYLFGVVAICHRPLDLV